MFGGDRSPAQSERPWARSSVRTGRSSSSRQSTSRVSSPWCSGPKSRTRRSAGTDIFLKATTKASRCRTTVTRTPSTVSAKSSGRGAGASSGSGVRRARRRASKQTVDIFSAKYDWAKSRELVVRRRLLLHAPLRMRTAADATRPQQSDVISSSPRTTVARPSATSASAITGYLGTHTTSCSAWKHGA